MAQKKRTKTRHINVNVRPGGFVSRLIGSGQKQDFSDIALLRQLLSKEKARIISALKQQKPQSIYALAKIIGRDFKSVREDLKLLEKFGLVEFHPVKTGKRNALVPTISIEQLQIVINT